MNRSTQGPASTSDSKNGSKIEKDLADQEHYADMLKKIEINSKAEHLHELEGVSIEKEIEQTREGLLKGSKNSFLAAAEYLWMETLRDNSVLIGPLNEFVQKNPKVRLSILSPLMPAVFLHGKYDALMEWSVRNIYDIHSKVPGIDRGGRAFLRLHQAIRRNRSEFGEESFLKCLFLFVCIGGKITPYHKELLVLDSLEKETEMQKRFAIYKIIVSGMFTIDGRKREEAEEERAQNRSVADILKLEHPCKEDQTAKIEEMQKEIDQIGYMLRKMEECGLQEYINGSRKEEASAGIILFYTPWQMLSMSLSLGISAETKMKILQIGLRTKNAQISEYSEDAASRFIREERPDVLKIASAAPGLLNAIIRTKDTGTVQRIAEQTVEKVFLLESAPEMVQQEEKRALAGLLHAWNVRIHERKGLDRGVSAFLVIPFFGVAGSVRARATERCAEFEYRALEETERLVAEKAKNTPCSELADREAVIALVLHPKKESQPALRGLVEVCDMLAEWTRKTGTLPKHLESFCQITEKFIKKSPFKGYEKLFCYLIRVPVTDAVLSQLNHIVSNMKESPELFSEQRAFELVRCASLMPASKTTLKSTFLSNVISLYLQAAQRDGAADTLFIKGVERHIAENKLENEAELQRMVRRLTLAIEKSKKPERSHAAKKEDAENTEVVQPQAVQQEAVAESAKREVVPDAHPGLDSKFDLFSFILGPPETLPEIPLFDAYRGYLNYAAVFLNLVAREALGSVRSEKRQERKQDLFTGKIESKQTKNDETTLKISVNEMEEDSIAKNDYVTIKNTELQGVIGSGIVVSLKKKSNIISVRLKNVTCTHSVAVEICIVTNLTTSIREFEAIERMRALPIRAKIFDFRGASKYKERKISAEAEQDLQEASKKVYDALNSSQRAAIEIALSQDVTLIQGPPGTGKTQSIVGLILQCLLRKWRVLVCAPSNAASWMVAEAAKKALPSSVPVQHLKKGEKKEALKVLGGTKVVFSTLSMAGSSAFSNHEFDVVVVDEACQATEPSTIIPLVVKPSRFILVGDPKQLPPTVISEERGLKYTLFERLSRNTPSVLLDTQYRMHSDIADFVNREFYENRLKNGVQRSSEVPLAFIETAGAKERVEENWEISNLQEAEVAVRLFKFLKTKYEKVGVITPYRKQASVISSLINSASPALRGNEGKNGEPEELEAVVSTVDGFQGQERDVIVFSTVRTKSLGFLTDYRRMNVALTRAKHSVIVLGNREVLSKDPRWSSFLRYCKDKEVFHTAKTLLAKFK